MIKLKPCPFCGAEPEVLLLKEGEHPRKWEILCKGRELPDKWENCPVNAFTFGPTFEATAEKWNRRSNDDQ